MIPQIADLFEKQIVLNLQQPKMLREEKYKKSSTKKNFRKQVC
jgi:hypothetical protein